MKIFINGKPADIVLESEKNVGDLLAGIEQWLQGSGNRLSGLDIDGQEIGVSEITRAMEQELKGLESINMRVSSWDELAVEAIMDLITYCRRYRDAPFEERKAIRNTWENSAAKAFLHSEIEDIHDIAGLSFAGDGPTPEQLTVFAEERLREFMEPGAEITAMEIPVSETAARLEEIPLDIQTGRDARAAETIQIFSRMGEKLFRLLETCKKRGLVPGSFQIDGMPVAGFLNDLGTTLGELTAAYKNQDSVLAGDLAEYELAPRLTKLYTAIKEFSREGARP